MNDAAGKDGLNGMSDAAGVIELWGVPQPLQGLTGDDRVSFSSFLSQEVRVITLASCLYEQKRESPRAK